MNDRPEPSTTTPSTYAQSRETLFREVYQAVHMAITAKLEGHERLLYNIGYGHGVEAAWEEATKRFSALIAEKPAPSPPPAVTQAQLEQSGADPEDRPSKDIVLSLIRQTPGMRGVEVVQAAEKAGTPLLERTIRTALHRLKIEELIRNEDGRWFVNEAAVAA
jgi:hypothetical protein